MLPTTSVNHLYPQRQVCRRSNRNLRRGRHRVRSSCNPTLFPAGVISIGLFLHLYVSLQSRSFAMPFALVRILLSHTKPPDHHSPYFGYTFLPQGRSFLPLLYMCWSRHPFLWRPLCYEPSRSFWNTPCHRFDIMLLGRRLASPFFLSPFVFSLVSVLLFSFTTRTLGSDNLLSFFSLYTCAVYAPLVFRCSLRRSRI